MKVAFWALGLIVIGLFGMVMINLFGNIAVTNQLNYTTMKNDVEASMYDALDQAYYRSGFCLCTNKQKTNGKYVFNDESEYELLDIVYKNNKETCPKTNCEILKGEYRLNKKVFAESLMRRLANVVNNNKDYKVTIKEVIEYPPKVSVRIDSHDTEFSPTEKDDSGYTIVNQMDAIIETWNTLPTPTPKPTAKPTAKPSNPSTNNDPPPAPTAAPTSGNGPNPPTYKTPVPAQPTARPTGNPSSGNGCGGSWDANPNSNTNAWTVC